MLKSGSSVVFLHVYHPTGPHICKSGTDYMPI